MEQWYKDHINKNLTELVRNTTCNALFLTTLRSRNVLSEEDVHCLNTYPNQLECASKFYDILLSRPGSFEILRQTLLDTRQTGAYEILNKCTHGVNDFYLNTRNAGRITYDKKSVIGRGCYNTKVFKGKFENRDVAVKWINSDDIEPETVIHEVEILQKIDHHDNIIRYYHLEISEDFAVIALELCDMNLTEYITNGSRHLTISPLDIIRQMTSAIVHLHEHQILHRDLKPENILLSSRGNPVGTVKVADFGLSKKTMDGRYSLSCRSTRFGTEGWIAPEVLPHVIAGSDVQTRLHMTQAADIFSLGCIFYYVITDGIHPFGDIIHRQTNIVDYSPKVSLSHLKYAVQKLLPVICKMISKNPSRRPSAQMVLADEYLRTSFCWARKTYLAEEDNKIADLLKQMTMENTTEQLKPGQKTQPTFLYDRLFKPTYTNYVVEHQGIKEFLLSPDKSVLVIKTLFPEICKDRVLDTVNDSLGVLKVNEYGQIDNYDNLQGDAFILLTHWIRQETLNTITNCCKKIIVITSELVGNIRYDDFIQDKLEWSHLSDAFKVDVLSSLEIKGFNDLRDDVFGFLNNFISKYPEYFIETLVDEVLVSFIEGSPDPFVVTKIILCFVENNLKFCAGALGCSMQKLINLLVPVMYATFPNRFGETPVFAIDDFKSEILCNSGIIKRANTLDSRRSTYMFSYQCIGYSVMAQVLISKYVHHAGLKPEKIWKSFLSLNEKTCRFLGLFGAEYAVNEFYHDSKDVVVKTHETNKTKLLYTEYDFNFPHLLYFFETIIKTQNPTSIDFFSDDHVWLSHFLLACIKNNLTNILQLFSSQQKYSSVLKNKYFLLLAAKHSNISTISLVWKWFCKHSQAQPQDFVIEYYLPDSGMSAITPLHIAIHRGDLSIVEYFMNALSFQDFLKEKCMLDLIHHVTMHTKSLPHNAIKTQIGIINLLTRRNSKLLYYELSYKNATPILMENIHIDLLVPLLKQMTGINASTGLQFVGHVATTYLDVHEFNDFVKLLLKLKLHSCLSGIVKTGNNLFHAVLQKYEYSYEALKNLCDAYVDINHKNNMGNTPLQLSILLRKPEQVLESLIRLGAVWNTDKLRDFIFYQAVVQGNVDTLSYFLKLFIEYNCNLRINFADFHTASQKHKDCLGCSTALSYLLYAYVYCEKNYNNIIKCLLSHGITEISAYLNRNDRGEYVQESNANLPLYVFFLLHTESDQDRTYLVRVRDEQSYNFLRQCVKNYMKK